MTESPDEQKLLRVGKAVHAHGASEEIPEVTGGPSLFKARFHTCLQHLDKPEVLRAPACPDAVE